MASLRDIVKEYQDELRTGIVWVAFWKEGRSWNADYFYLELNDYLYPHDISRLEEIRQKDPAAIVVNGYYSGYLGEDMNLDELTAGVRHHYENGYSNIKEFIEAHDDRLSPEEIEKGRAAAHAAGLPFSERPFRDGEDFDPYVFDGSMSIEDYNLMQSMIEKERSERMDEPILSGYLSNLRKYTEGRPAGEWVTFPTTAEHLKEVFDRIGIDFKENGEWHFTEYQSAIPGLAARLGENEHPDELNYLAKLLEMQRDGDKELFTAAVTLGDHASSVQELINLAQNLDCYWLYPSVKNEEDYGHYLVEELEEPEIPEEARKYFMYEEYGRDAAINDGGLFTEQGYIYNNQNTFTQWYDGRDVPEEYRVTPTPPEPEQPDLEAAAEPRPVTPIIPTSTDKEEKVKEVTARLEQGISEMFDSERYSDYLRVMSKFPRYSLNNTILIAMQAPDATHIMGYNAWKDPAIGRYVKENEKGIRIFAPQKVKKKVDKTDPETGKPIIGEDGKPVKEEKEVIIPKFHVVCVYDVAQTDGKELPTLTDELTGNVPHYHDFFAALERTSPFSIGFQPLPEGVKGRCFYNEQRIAVNEGMSEPQNIKTAIHEIAHATLHDTAPDDPARPDRRTREVQAESVAYAVCQHYGLDTSDYSFGYIAGWSSGRELAELKGSLETIRSTAAKLIETIDGHFAEIQKAHEQEQTGTITEPEAAEPEPRPQEQPETQPQDPAPENGQEVQEETVSSKPQPEEPETPESSPEPAAQENTPQTAAPYYTINEAAARRAKDMNSFSDYQPGSATAEYRHYVDEAVKIAERQKARTDPMYHDKIDSLLDTYARKLAANMNKGYEIDARVPSILIAGGSNFPVRKKEKQNAARDTNYREWQEIQGLLDKIRSTGMGGISADDPQAVQKLEKKLAGLEKSQETMKAVNAYYRKHKTLDGCPHLSPEGIEKLKAGMSSQWHIEDKPYPTWALSNNNAEIRRVKDRIKSLTRQKEIGYTGWEFEGGKVEANTQDNRLQIFFDGKPDADVRENLKRNGFRWSPKAGAWQRQLNDNAYFAANYVKAIAPLSGEKPTDLQRAHIRQQKQEAKQTEDAPREKAAMPEYIYKIEANPRSESLNDRFFLQAYLPQEDGTAKIGDVLYIGTPEKCRELMGQLNAGELTQGEIKELYAKAQEQPEAAQENDTFSIYQLKDGEETRDFRFEPYDRLQAAGLAVERGNYELIYTAPLTAGTSLDDIFTRFNIDHPKDYKGHSLSVSDVVVLHQNGQDTAHYVDRAGYKEVPEFLQEKQPQRENPLKAAEQTTEQNYNMIDGQINNTPTAAELEAKAKAGEQISLFEYAKALKEESTPGKAAKPEKKPSIRAQLKASKEQAAQKKPAKQKSQDLERS